MVSRCWLKPALFSTSQHLETMAALPSRSEAAMQGYVDVMSCVASLRRQRANAPTMADLYPNMSWENFPQEVAKMYRMKKEGMYEEPKESVMAIQRKDYPDDHQGPWYRPLSQVKTGSTLPPAVESLLWQ
mmetsp:Transcript_43828/g.117594  ORF Transcript_43828/g.117594 Transcript_43828/m.117594 type:complete len:130 (-) Transcript_43828:54-443(-)